MSTNFYWYQDEKPCPCCKREFEAIHIGKRSGGRCFKLHVISDQGLNTIDDWEAFLLSGGVIKDQYDKILTPNEMMAEIRSIDKTDLRRQSINGGSCIAHGEGNWDYVEGSFS